MDRECRFGVSCHWNGRQSRDTHGPHVYAVIRDPVHGVWRITQRLAVQLSILFNSNSKHINYFGIAFHPYHINTLICHKPSCQAFRPCENKAQRTLGSYTNLDQILSSEYRPSINQNLNQTLAS